MDNYSLISGRLLYGKGTATATTKDAGEHQILKTSLCFSEFEWTQLSEHNNW